MFRRRQKDDDYLGPSRGLAKLFHRTMMFLLWPLRHPIWFVLLLLVMFLAPTFRGVKPAEVHLWYWGHIKNMFSTVGTAVSDKTKEIMPELSNVSLPSITVKSTANKAVPVPEVVEMPVPESRRKMFEKAKAVPVAIDIMQQNNVAKAPVQPQVPSSETNAAPTKAKADETVAVQKKKLALVYVSEAKFIHGPAVVVNANELRVNRESVILYGIYVDPNTQKGQEAKIFLDKTIAGKTVNCRVEAYTYQGVATAICLIDSVNLNKKLVEMGYSKNVSLE